jgi:hypothetical protein
VKYTTFWPNEICWTQKWQSESCNTYGVSLLSSTRFRMQDTWIHMTFITQFETMMPIIVDKNLKN